MQILVADIEIRGDPHVAIGLSESIMPIYEIFSGGYQPTYYAYPSIVKFVWPDDLTLGKPRGMTVAQIEEKYGLLYARRPVSVGEEEDLPLVRWADKYGGDADGDTPFPDDTLEVAW